MKNEKREMSIMDAFLALEELEWDEPTTESLNEGKSFDVQDSKAMQAAEKFTTADEVKETPLEVVDVDADATEHLQNNVDYVGQHILRCTSCKTPRFVNPDEYIEVEGQPGIVKIDPIKVSNEQYAECPKCHRPDATYTVEGQCAVVSKEEPEEAKFDNDVPAEEPAPEEAPVETPETTEPTAAIPEVPEETAYDETSAEDDTADIEDHTGEEVEDDFNWDDTEPLPEETPEEETTSDDASLFSKIEEPEEKKESLEEAESEEAPETETEEETTEETTEEVLPVTVKEFLDNNFIDTDKIETIVIKNNDSEIYSGNLEDLPDDLLNSEMCGFDAPEGLGINTSKEGKEPIVDEEGNKIDVNRKVSDVLAPFTGTVNIVVYDSETTDEITRGSVEDVITEQGDLFFDSFDTPTRLEITICEPEITESYVTESKAQGAELELVERIIDANGMKSYNIEKYGTDEYWISDSIVNLEDLDTIYDCYVKPIGDDDLVREFKQVTGYEDAIDEAIKKETIQETVGDTESEALAKARDLLKRTDAIAVIYGYLSGGRFHALKEVIPCKDEDTLKDKTEIITLRYRPQGSIRVAYRSYLDEEKEAEEVTTEAHETETEKEVCPECGKEVCECNKNVSEQLTESVDDNQRVKSFATRKELAEAVETLKNNNRPYSIRRSQTEGCRYDLLTEAVWRPSGREVLNWRNENDAEMREVLTSVFDKAAVVVAAVDRVYPGAQINEQEFLDDFINDLAHWGAFRNINNFRNVLQNRDELSDEALNNYVESPNFISAAASGQLPGITLPDDVMQRAREQHEYDDEDEEIDDEEWEEADDDLPEMPAARPAPNHGFNQNQANRTVRELEDALRRAGIDPSRFGFPGVGNPNAPQDAAGTPDAQPAHDQPVRPAGGLRDRRDPQQQPQAGTRPFFGGGAQPAAPQGRILRPQQPQPAPAQPAHAQGEGGLRANRPQQAPAEPETQLGSNNNKFFDPEFADDDMFGESFKKEISESSPIEINEATNEEGEIVKFSKDTHFMGESITINSTDNSTNSVDRTKETDTTPETPVEEDLFDGVKGVVSGVANGVNGIVDGVKSVFEEKEKTDEGLGLFGIGDINVNLDAHNFGGTGNNVDVLGGKKDEGLLPGLDNLPLPKLPGLTEDTDVSEMDPAVANILTTDDPDEDAVFKKELQDYEDSKLVDPYDAAEFDGHEVFNENKFDKKINEYFSESYDDTVVYTTTSGSIDKTSGKIVLEGIVKSDDKSSKVSFTLNPIKEGYEVTNDLSDEKITIHENFNVMHNIVRSDDKKKIEAFIDEYIKEDLRKDYKEEILEMDDKTYQLAIALADLVCKDCLQYAETFIRDLK